MPKLPRMRQTREASSAPQRAQPGAPPRGAVPRHLAPGAIVQRAMAAPRSLRPAELISMQRTIGNRAAGMILRRAPVQTKLIVNAPQDEYEREADRVAEAVLRMPAAPREETWGQRVSSEIKPDAIKSGDGSFAASEDFTRRLHASFGQGSPLPPPLRETFETNFDADFRGVRIHSGEQASQLSHDIQAQAFTHGSDIFLRASNYAPGTATGKRLLAHELTHVVQQGAAPPKAATAANQVTGAAAAAPGMGAERIQRLKWKGTEWDKATRAGVSEYGARGCLLVEDKTEDDPVIVKSREDVPAEIMLAANIHPTETGDIPIETPGVRVLQGDERTKVSQKLKVLMEPLNANPNPYWTPKKAKSKERTDSDLKKGRDKAKKQLNGVNNPGTLVFEYAQGTDFQDVIGEKSQKLPKVFKDENLVKALGNATAIDIFMGNLDRVLNFNMGNFRVVRPKEFGKKKRVQKLVLIDNVEGGTYFKTFTKRTIGGDTEFPSQQTYEKWKGQPHPTWLRDSKFDDLAQVIIDGAKKKLPSGVVKQIEGGIESNMKIWLTNGLDAGRNRLENLTMSDFLRNMENTDILTDILTDKGLDEVKDSIRLRYQFIFQSPIKEPPDDSLIIHRDKPWRQEPTAAGASSQMTAMAKKLPQLPPLPASQQPQPASYVASPAITLRPPPAPLVPALTTSTTPLSSSSGASGAPTPRDPTRRYVLDPDVALLSVKSPRVAMRPATTTPSSMATTTAPPKITEMGEGQLANHRRMLASLLEYAPSKEDKARIDDEIAAVDQERERRKIEERANASKQ